MPKEMFYSPWGEGSEQKPPMSREEQKKMVSNLMKLRPVKGPDQTPEDQSSR